jgi:hypothetical protein
VAQPNMALSLRRQIPQPPLIRTATVTWGSIALAVAMGLSIPFVSYEIMSAVALLLIPLVILWVLQKRVGGSTVLSAPVLFILTYYVMSYIGGIIPGKVSDLLDFDTRLRAAIVFCSGMVAFFASSILVVASTRFNAKAEIMAFRNAIGRDECPPAGAAVLRFLLFTSVLSIGISYVFYYGGHIPIADALSLLSAGGLETHDLLAAARLDIVYRTGSSFLDQFRYVLGPFSNLALLLLSIRWGNRRFMWIAWMIMPITVLLLVGTGQRHPLVAFILMTIVSLNYVGQKWLKRSTPVIGGFAFSILVGQTYLLGRFTKTGDPLGDLLVACGQILDRFVRPSAEVSYRTLSLFSDLPPRFGTTWLNDLTGLVPFVPPLQEPFTRELFRSLNGTEGTASPPGFVEAFVNLGNLGPIIVGAILGAVLTFLFVWGVRKTIASSVPVVDALFVGFFTYVFARVGQAGLTQPLYFGVIVVVPYWWCIQRILGKRTPGRYELQRKD